MSMNRGKGPTGLDAISEITKRLGDLADHMKTAFEEGADAAQEQQANAGSHQRTFTINTPRGPLTGVAGYSFRMGGLGEAADGSSEVMDHEYQAQRPAKPQQSEPREPLVDTYVEDREIIVTAELPGVDLDDVSVGLEGQDLSIETTSGRAFKKALILSEPVDPTSLRTSLRNGILEVRLDRILDGDVA